MELYDLEIHQKKVGPDYHRLRNNGKKEVSSKIYETGIWAPETEIMKEKTVVKDQVTKQREQRILGECWQWEANGQCSKGDNCSFRHDVKKRAKMTQANSSPNSFMQQSERKTSRTRSLRGKVPVGKCFNCPARITSKELAPIHSVKSGILQNACSTRSSGCRFGEKCSHAHRQVDGQPSKRSKKNDMTIVQ